MNTTYYSEKRMTIDCKAPYSNVLRELSSEQVDYIIVFCMLFRQESHYSEIRSS